VSVWAQSSLMQVATGAGIAGLASGIVWLIALLRGRAREDGFSRQMRVELSGLIDQQSRDFSARLSEIARKVECLEAQAPQVASMLRAGTGRNDRSRAVRLLRAGLAPATVASSLGVGTCEIHLIAAVSNALSANAAGRDA